MTNKQQYDAEYRKAHQAEIKAYRKAYRAKNKEKLQTDARKYYEANKEKVISAAKAWASENPELVKAKTSRYYQENKEKVIAATKRYAAENADAVAAQKAEYYKRHRAKFRAIASEWVKNNKDAIRAYRHVRRAQIGADRLSKDIVARLMVLQKGKCPCCRADISTGKNHIDHIIPLASGGRNIDENVQLLCVTCNTKKGAKHPVRFMQSMGYLC